VPTTLVGLDVTFSVPVGEADVRRLASGGPAGAAAAAMLGSAVEFYHQTRGTTAVAVHDAVAVVQVLRPDLLPTERCTITVDCSYGPSRGATLVDRRAPLSWSAVVTSAAVGPVVDLIVGRIVAHGR
jgi:pyrimidine-specific ribonucleoside hydrolase